MAQKNKNSKEKSSAVIGKKKNLKKAVIAVTAVFAVLAVLCAVLGQIESSLKKSNEKKKNDIEQMNFNPDGILSVDYYEPDYSADIFEEYEYTSKERSIKFTADGQSIVLGDYTADELTAGQRFWVRYFDAVISGDAESYGEMIADDYSGNPNVFGKDPKNKKFPMQRIYDISVKLMGETPAGDAGNTYNGEPAQFGVYEVSYKIQKNDGEYRLGLPSDKTIPVIFEIATTNPGTDDEKTVIRRAYLYSDIEFDSEEN